MVDTAFQADAFQNDAYQIAAIAAATSVTLDDLTPSGTGLLAIEASEGVTLDDLTSSGYGRQFILPYLDNFIAGDSPPKRRPVPAITVPLLPPYDVSATLRALMAAQLAHSLGGNVTALSSRLHSVEGLVRGQTEDDEDVAALLMAAA